MPTICEPALLQRMADLLSRVAVTETFAGRSGILSGLPPVTVNRSEANRLLDLDMIIEQWAALGRDKKSGVRPLIVIVDNAMRHLGDWQSDLTEAFQDVRRELEASYAGDVQPKELPPIEPEKLLFKGRDERVSAFFLTKAIETARSVCRLQVPRVFGGTPRPGQSMYGTGWLIAPSLIITNHHVIEARQRQIEPAATAAEFRAQAERTTAWFDYLREGGPYVEVRGFTLEASDDRLDYALLRLREPESVADRMRLPLISQQPAIDRGYRLNIAQHSGGGPLIYAIRNNFYVGTGSSAEYLRYLTDTEPGASGSPVMNDLWDVIGLHHAAQPIPPEYYASLPQERFRTLPEETAKGEVITYHNEGIAIHAILRDLSDALRAEIAQAQGWPAQDG